MQYLTPQERFANGRGGAQREQLVGVLVRSVIAVAHGVRNPQTTTETFVRSRWGSDAVPDIASVLKAESAPATTFTSGWASELAPITLAIVGALVPFSAGADLQQRGIRLSLHGVKQINIPSLAVPFADFVAQGASIPVADGNVEHRCIAVAVQDGDDRQTHARNGRGRQRRGVDEAGVARCSWPEPRSPNV